MSISFAIYIEIWYRLRMEPEKMATKIYKVKKKLNLLFIGCLILASSFLLVPADKMFALLDWAGFDATTISDIVSTSTTNKHAHMEAAFSPQQGAIDLVLRTINSAEKSIRVAAYSFTYPPIAEALVNAHRRGVDVKVVLDGKQREDKHSVFRYLKNNNIETRVNFSYAIMHHKFMIIDHKTLQLGSFNYTKSAEKRNAENVLVIREAPDILDAYLRQWQKLWNESE